MLSHQKLFVTMEQQIESGIDLINEYNASLEALDAALQSLEELESGQDAGLLTVQQKLGAQLSMEGISLEGVVVHLNSSQVQVVIDFLKKWIPILLQKARELAKKFIAWAKIQLKKVDERLSKLSLQLKSKSHGSMSAEFKGTQRGLFVLATTPVMREFGWNRGLRLDKIFDRQEFHGVHGFVEDLLTSGAEGRPPAATYHFFETALGEWLTFGQDRLFVYDQHRWSDGPEGFAEYLRKLPDPTAITSEYNQKLTLGVETLKIEASTHELEQTIKFLSQKQMDMLAGARELEEIGLKFEKRLKQMGKNLDELEGTEALAHKNAIKLINYILKASQVGLQSRLSALGAAVGILEALAK